MRVLVVEDNLELNEIVSSALKNDGFEVLSAFNGKTARDHSFLNRPDVILLDIMLPDGKGYDLISYFKNNGDPYIVMMSALEEEETRRTAYENGADDYLIKPITLFELSYKLKAISKRVKTKNMSYSIGDISFDMESLELRCQNNVLILQRSQMTVLKLLFDKYSNNEILDKNEIIDFDGAGKSISFRIHTLIGRLRKNLAEVGTEKVVIENVYGKGYALSVI